MDLLTQLYRTTLCWLDRWPDGCLTFALRLDLVLLLATLFALFAFLFGNRHIVLQMLAAVVGVLLAMLVPLGPASFWPALLKLWVLLPGAIVALFLPAILSVLLVPRHGQQRRLRRLLYSCCALLIIAQILFSLVS